MAIHAALSHLTHYRYDRLVDLGPQIMGRDQLVERPTAPASTPTQTQSQLQNQSQSPSQFQTPD